MAKKVRNRKNNKYALVIKVVISLSLLLFLAFRLDWQQLSRLVANMSVIPIAAAVACIILAMLISTVKWQQVLIASGHNVGIYRLWQAYWAGLFFNNFMPGSIGGDALRIIWTGRQVRDYAGVAASVVVERILATAGLAICGLLGALLVSRTDALYCQALWILLLISFFLLFLVFWGDRLFTPSTHTRAGKFISEFAAAGRSVRGNIGPLMKAAVLSILFQVSVVAVNLAVFQALGISAAAFDLLLFVIPLTSAAAMLPLGINGYGVREGAYVLLLGSYGISQEASVAASLIYAILISLCSLYGAALFIVCRNEGRERHEVQQSLNESVG